MAAVLRFHHLLLHFYHQTKTSHVIIPRYSKLLPKSFMPLFVFNPRSHLRTLVLPKDQRAVTGDSAINGDEIGTTIAAIVTSLGGGPAAVGIIRLSGPSAVDVAGRVFRPAVKGEKNEGRKWKPRSHSVEYGSVVDTSGDVIDEVRFLLFLVNFCVKNSFLNLLSSDILIY